MKREVERDCSELCSKKKPSILRKTGKEDMLELTLQVYDCSPVPDHQLFLPFTLAGMLMSTGTVLPDVLQFGQNNFF